MKFRPENRSNPFDNWLIRLCAHAAAQGGMYLAIYWSVVEGSWIPLAVAFATFIGVESLWLYYRLRC